MSIDNPRNPKRSLIDNPKKLKDISKKNNERNPNTSLINTTQETQRDLLFPCNPNI